MRTANIDVLVRRRERMMMNLEKPAAVVARTLVKLCWSPQLVGVVCSVLSTDSCYDCEDFTRGSGQVRV